MSSSQHKGSSRSAIPPPTSYRDDPTASYRDNDEESSPSVFDWHSSESAAARGGSTNKPKQQKESFQIDDNGHDFDPDAEIPFTPISLHDDDDDSEVSGSMALRPHDGILSKVTRRNGGNGYNAVAGQEEAEEGRLFVGGGWGRHGSSTDWTGCCRYKKSGGGCTTTSCLMVVFVTLTLLAGYLGYEAGLPANITTLDSIETNDAADDDDHNGLITSPKQTTTNGDLWLQWIKDSKSQLNHPHLPHIHLNFTKHHPIISTDSSNQKTLSFPPLSQSELLVQSEHIFQSCSERSIATTLGRDACLSLCHGHYCCFEKDVEFGSCVTTMNSYCFVYAACENLILDFGFTNVNVEDGAKIGGGGGSVDVDGLNREDFELLEATCSKENVATLEGIRDCNAFCQHHLCCFSEDEGENCREGQREECEAYESCRVLVEPKGGDDDDEGGSGKEGGGGESTAITVTSEQVELAVYDACYFGNDESKITQSLVAKCHNICSSRYCCFESQNIVSSCRETVGDFECKLYSLCEQMINERGEEVQNFIELDKKEFGTDSGSGSSVNNNNGVDSGTSYRPGSNGVFIDETEFEATVSEVRAVCNPDIPGDDSWVTNCHSMCADYLCCFATEGTGSNCKDVHGSDVCEAYAGCKVLSSSSSSTTSPAAKLPPASQQPQSQSSQPSEEIMKQVQLDEMAEACVPKIRRDYDLRERCRKVCEPRDCCWQSGPGNCYAMNTDWCDEFSMCEILVV